LFFFCAQWRLVDSFWWLSVKTRNPRNGHVLFGDVLWLGTYVLYAHTHACLCVRIFGYEKYISTGVFSKIFIAFLTRMFSKIICKNYTRDTKIINYIVYSKMYRYILILIYVFVFVYVQCVFFLLVNTFLVETENRTLLYVYHYTQLVIRRSQSIVTKLVRKIYTSINECKFEWGL
jgi:hypothetical protein